MKHTLLLALLTLCPAAYAAGEPLVFDGQAPYVMPEIVASNIRSECNLPQYQAAAFSRAAQNAGLALEMKPGESGNAAPRYVKLQIMNAVSSGNAFIGHKKQIILGAKLYRDGKEVGNFNATRSSMGGVGGGFMGSCSVLERCADTLAEDLVRWLRQQQQQEEMNATRQPDGKKPEAVPAGATPAS